MWCQKKVTWNNQDVFFFALDVASTTTLHKQFIQGFMKLIAVKSYFREDSGKWFFFHVQEKETIIQSHPQNKISLVQGHEEIQYIT